MDPFNEGSNNDFETVDPPVSSTTGGGDPFGDSDDLYGSGSGGDLLNLGGPPQPEKPSAPSAPAMDPFSEPDTSFDPLAPSKPEPPAVKENSAPEKEASPCCASSSTCCAWLQNMDPRVVDLIYWRDVKKSGVVFGCTMLTLLALALYSVVSVLAYLALAVMVVTLSFTSYKKVLAAVQKSQDGNPFKQYLEMDVSLPEDRVHQAVDIVLTHVNALITAARRLFLVEDFVDSIKFALLLWVLTYIGAWFNGLTLIILAIMTMFSAPKVYQTHKTQIDNYLELAITQVKNVVEQVKAKIPLPGKKKQQ